jgi:hypothetical protein
MVVVVVEAAFQLIVKLVPQYNLREIYQVKVDQSDDPNS